MISIFAKRAFLNVNNSQPFEYKGEAPKRGHLQRVSSMIRADQIATQIGAKLNPTEGFENDVCIYVKPHIKADEDFEFKGVRSYVDIVDGWGLLPVLGKHPEVGVIACSKQDFEILSRVLPEHKIVFIPQHHCNFDREKRTREGIKTVGVIGVKEAFPFIPQEIRDGLKERGIEFLEYSKFFTREDIINFYKQIDVQLIWRPYKMRLSNPLKIVNASSFGIPTIAFKESVFNEMYDTCRQVDTVEGFFEELDFLLKNQDAYQEHSRFGLERSEDYHIEKVGELYQQL